MKQKIMAIALAVALAVSGIAPGQTASEVHAAEREGAELPPETAQEIELGQDYNVHLDEHESAYYKFVPKTDGIYIFSKNNNGDTAAGTLYSNVMKPLYVNIWGEFDIEGYLFAGRTYYLKASSVYDENAFHL